MVTPALMSSTEANRNANDLVMRRPYCLGL